MIPAHNQYFPILKVKRGEKTALESIAPSLHNRITPLLEFVECSVEQSPSAHLTNAFRDLVNCTKYYQRCFIDTRELSTLSRADNIAATVFTRAEQMGIAFVPVTSVSRSHDVEPAIRFKDRGIALRLSQAELENGNLNRDIIRFVDKHTLAPESIDLIMDLGAVDTMIVDGICAMSESFLSAVPYHSKWRTFVLSACSFPKKLSAVKRDSSGNFERSEWLSWRDNFYRNRHSLTRLPLFSDCAIQHPSGVEGFDFRIHPVSAAIRYAQEESWLIIRGVSTKTPSKSAKEQFPRLADRLYSGSLKDLYLGSDHCEGCASIKKASIGHKGFGSPEIWRRIGTIHHLTTVLQQLSSLPEA